VAAEGMFAAVRFGREEAPYPEVVWIERIDTRTVLLFDDDSRLEVETGVLLRELLTTEIILELVTRVNELRDEIEEAG
jgi:hypothetical protein